MERDTIVMVFGTFDLLHEGHKYFLNEARNCGDLTVIIARDNRVKELKGEYPHDNESKRLEKVKSLGLKNVFIGHETNVYHFVDLIKPDIICLGYDQTHFVDKLMKDYPKIKIVRLQPYKEEIYKSSKLRNSI